MLLDSCFTESFFKYYGEHYPKHYIEWKNPHLE